MACKASVHVHPNKSGQNPMRCDAECQACTLQGCLGGTVGDEGDDEARLLTHT
jgi:hypothetical protein